MILLLLVLLGLGQVTSDDFVPVTGDVISRLNACTCVIADPEYAHFRKVGNVASHEGFFHLVLGGNATEVVMSTMKACRASMELRQLGLFRRVLKINEGKNSMGLYSQNSTEQIQRHFERTLTGMTSRCEHALTSTIDVLSLFFNNFNEGPDVTHSTHVSNVLRAQLEYASDYRGLVKLAVAQEKKLLQRSGVRPSKIQEILKDRGTIRNKRGNGTLDSVWLGLNQKAEEFEVPPEFQCNKTEGGLKWDEEPWAEDDPRQQSEWWFSRFLSGNWPTFPLPVCYDYLPKAKNSQVDFAKWNSLVAEVQQKIHEMSRKERRRMARSNKKSASDFRFHHLTKRQLLVLLATAAISLGSVLYNEFQINHMVSSANKNVDSTIRQFDRINHRLAISEHALNMLHASVSLIEKQLEVNGLQLEAIEGILETRVSFDTYYDELARVLAGYTGLAQDELRPEFVNIQALTHELQVAEHQLQKQGLTLGIKEVDQVFSAPLSHVVYANGSVNAIVHLKVYRKSNEFSLFQYVPLPFSHDEKTSFTLGAENKILAVSRDETQFYTISEADLSTCDRMGDIRVCANANVVSKKSDSSCLSAVYKGQWATAAKRCLYRPAPAAETVIQINSNQFFIHAATNTDIKFECRDGEQVKSRKEFISGLNLVTVQPLCTAATDSHVLSGQLAYSVNIQPLESHPVELPELFATDGVPFFMNDMELLKNYSSSIDAYETSVESVAKNFVHFKKTGILKTLENAWSRFKMYIIGAFVLVLVCLLGYLILPGLCSFLYRRCLTSSKSSRSLPGGQRNKLSTGSRWAALRSSIRFRTSAPSHLDTLRKSAETNPEEAASFLSKMKQDDPGFDENNVLALAKIIKINQDHDMEMKMMKEHDAEHKH